jgi:pimeloyl-ACP methyl ester carboxylesterase
MPIETRSHKILNSIKRGVVGIIVVVLLLAIAGTVYQTAASEADRPNFPPPGNLIDVGGFKMHIYCMGEGDPTVVLEAMSGGTSAHWGWIQPEVAKEAKVCVYDRAGFGWSEPDPEPQSLARTVRNLHTLLVNANINKPYILVGHSVGGVYIRQFAADYPDEVIGMVLMDEAVPQQFERYPEMFKEGDDYLRTSTVFPALARLGVFHLYFSLGGKMGFADLPEPQKSEVKAFWSSPEYFVAQRAEIAAGRELWGQALKLGKLGDLPLMIISRGLGLDDDWPNYQDDLATLSTNSGHITLAGANHVALVFNPDYARKVSDAILQVVDSLRTGKRLAAQK